MAKTVIMACTVLAWCSLGRDGGGNMEVITPSDVFSKKHELVAEMTAPVFCCMTTVIMYLYGLWIPTRYCINFSLIELIQWGTFSSIQRASLSTSSAIS